MVISDVTQLKPIIEKKLKEIYSTYITSIKIEKAALIGSSWLVRVSAIQISGSSGFFELTIDAKTETVLSYSKIGE